jgi:hypothetical protein
MPHQMRWKIKQDCDIILREIAKAGSKISELYLLYSSAGKEKETEMLKVGLEASKQLFVLIKCFRDMI